MNGETTDPDGWRAMFPTPVRRRRPIRAERDRSEAILAASLAVADRGEQVRSQVRGAIVEALTARPAGAPGRGRRGPPRATDPVRRRAGRDPSVRRDGRARRRGRGLRLQVGRARHQRRRAAPARRRADPRRRRGRAARGRARRVRRRAVVRGPARPPDGAAGGTAAASRSRRSTSSPARRDDRAAGPTTPDAGAPFRVRFDEAGARRPAADVRAAPLRAGPRLAPLGGARLRPGVVRASTA